MQSPLQFPGLEVLQSGGSYVVSFPSIDDFTDNKRRSACHLRIEKDANAATREMRHLAVVVLGASGDLAKRKT